MSRHGFRRKRFSNAGALGRARFVRPPFAVKYIKENAWIFPLALKLTGLVCSTGINTRRKIGTTPRLLFCCHVAELTCQDFTLVLQGADARNIGGSSL